MSRSFLRPLAIVAAFAGLAAYATIMLRGPQGLSVLEQKRQQIRTLEVQNADLNRDIQAKKEFIDRLKHDPATQELAIRKHLHKERPGETDFILPKQSTSSNPAASVHPQ